MAAPEHRETHVPAITSREEHTLGLLVAQSFRGFGADPLVVALGPDHLARDRQHEGQDAVDSSIGLCVAAIDVDGEPVGLGHPDQLLGRGAGEDLVEPHGVVGGDKAIGVGAGHDPQLMVRRWPSQPPAGAPLKPVSPRAGAASGCAAGQEVSSRRSLPP